MDNINIIRILSTNGSQVIEVNGYNTDGIDVGTLATGVYVVAIFTIDNKVYYEKVLKIAN